MGAKLRVEFTKVEATATVRCLRRIVAVLSVLSFVGIIIFFYLFAIIAYQVY
jgi:hypothetical protein